jgi:hypothetical protein
MTTTPEVPMPEPVGSTTYFDMRYGEEVVRAAYTADQLRAYADAWCEKLREEMQRAFQENEEWYCEKHPWALMGHDGCNGAGMLDCARWPFVKNTYRLKDQEIRELHYLYGFLAKRALEQSPPDVSAKMDVSITFDGDEAVEIQCYGSARDMRRLHARIGYWHNLQAERDALAERVKAMESANQSRSAASMSQCSQTTQALIRMLVERDRRGLAKYGQTLDRPDLTRAEWLQHMAEEMLDGAGYALAAIRTGAAIDAAGGDQA